MTPDIGKRYRILHETRTSYQHNVSLSQQLLHLTPRNCHWQTCHEHRLEITPASQDWVERVDYFGNPTRSITLTRPHKTLLIVSSAVLTLTARLSRAQIEGSPAWESLRASLVNSVGASDVEPFHFLYESPHIACSPELSAYALSSFTQKRPVLEASLDLCARIFRDFEFDDKATTIATPLSEVIAGRRGVCQDFAHLMIGCLRSLGLACRYVSGYLLTTPPPGQARMIGADASHAWVAVYCPGFGWVDFDPTNCCLVQDEHITLAWGRDFSDVTPIRGIVLGGGQQKLEVKVTVTPIEMTSSGT